MGFIPININDTEFTDAERAVLRDLAAHKKLSHTLAVALKEYLHKLNPELYDPAPKDLKEIRTIEDLDALKKDYANRNPQKTMYVINLLMDKLALKLKDKGLIRYWYDGNNLFVED